MKSERHRHRRRGSANRRRSVVFLGKKQISFLFFFQARGGPSEPRISPSPLPLLPLPSPAASASLAASTTGAHRSTGEHRSGSSLTALASSATAALAFPLCSSWSAQAWARGAVAEGGPPRLRERPAWRTATAEEGGRPLPLLLQVLLLLPPAPSLPQSPLSLPLPLFLPLPLLLRLSPPPLVARFSAWAQLTHALELSGWRQTTRSKTAKARS